MRNMFTGIIAMVLTLSMSACSTAEETTNPEEMATVGEKQQTATINQITASEFDKVKTEKNAIVIDVRTPGEVAEGYIDGATKFIDVNGSDFNAEIAKLDKTANYIVYCRSGARSMRASEIMIQQGFTNVYNLQGGIMGWTGKIIK